MKAEQDLDPAFVRIVRRRERVARLRILQWRAKRYRDSVLARLGLNLRAEPSKPWTWRDRFVAAMLIVVAAWFLIGLGEQAGRRDICQLVDNDPAACAQYRDGGLTIRY